MAREPATGSTRFLESRLEGPVAYLALNRPQIRNAFNDEVVRELTDWSERIAVRTDIRVVVLSGKGKVFCAGADLEWMAKVASYSREENLHDAERLARMLEALDTLPQALIGRVHGAAIAGGAGLTTVCDLVVAAEDAIFAFTEVNLGIVPAVISPYVLSRIGPSAARELFLTGNRIDASRAREIGLVHDVVAPADLDAAVERRVRELLSSGPRAVASAKQLLRSVHGLSAKDAAKTTAEFLAEGRASVEGRAGIEAFLSKKTPPWVRDR